MRPASDRDRPSSSTRDALSRRRPGLEHRSDERPHHVAEEAVRGDREVEPVAVVFPARREHVAQKHVVLGLGRREGTEVVLAHEQRGRLLQSPDVDGTRPPELAARIERGARGAGAHAVAIRARPRREARVKRFRCLVGAKNGDVLGQRRVQCLGGARNRRTAFDVDARHLRGRMDARVRPPGHSEAVPSAETRRRARPATHLRQCAVRGWRAQPWNSVPSYSSVSLSFTT